MAADETLAAVSAVLRSLCQEELQSLNHTIYTKASTKYNATNRITLPGPQTSAKETLEDELVSLTQRMQFLQDKANTVNQALPDTPNEFPPSSPPLGAPTNGVQHSQRQSSAKPFFSRKNSTSIREARVSNILAGKTFSDEEMETIRDHLSKQSEEIKTQSTTIDDISRQLERQEHSLKDTFEKVENEDLRRLERELKKHAQANEAFQRALKEIGQVISSIAAGDLSKKVRIHAKEMDDEIVTFKRTINTMIDQLDAFGNEVSRVAKEVGTEGKLGGQAHLPLVQGIWRDVTYNGNAPIVCVIPECTNLRISQHDGHESYGPSTRNSRSDDRRCRRRFDKTDHTTSTRRDCSATDDYQHHGPATWGICTPSN